MLRWCVRQQGLHPKVGCSHGFHELSDQFAPVDRRSVPHHQRRAADLTAPVFQIRHRIFPDQRLLTHSGADPAIERQAAPERQVVARLPLGQDGRQLLGLPEARGLGAVPEEVGDPALLVEGELGSGTGVRTSMRIGRASRRAAAGEGRPLETHPGRERWR